MRLTLVTDANRMRTVTAVLDIGAGPNLISLESIHTAFIDRIRRTRQLSLKSATKPTVLFHVTVLIHVRLRKLRLRSWLGFVSNFSVPFLLGTNYKDLFIPVICPLER